MNAVDTHEIKSHLLEENANYRQLVEQHHQLDDRLHQLTAQHYLSTDEQFEEVTIKKRKLALKDQMENMAREYALGHVRS
jgi:uncharacterized protein YdcH (DUF465 family)